MLLTKTVMVKWHGTNRKYYVSKGYLYTKKGEEFEVKIEDLQEGSNINVTVKCDYCEREHPKQYYEYISSNKKGIIHKDCCSNGNCQELKRQESNLLKYNIESTNKLLDLRLRKRDIMNKKLEDESFVDNWNKKRKQTMLVNLGVEYAMQNQNVKLKAQKTWLKTLGVTNPSFSKEIIKKINQTMSINNTQKISQPQLFLHSIIGGKLNYLVDMYTLDITFPEEKIYIEYDGGGHDLSVKHGSVTIEEFNRKEIKRSYYLKNRGWKEIRIISKKDRLPKKETILEMIDFAKQYLSTNHSWIKFDIDNEIVISSQFNKRYEFGKVIYKKLYNFNGLFNEEVI